MISLQQLKADKRYSVLAAVWVLLAYNLFVVSGNSSFLLPAVIVILFTAFVDVVFVHFIFKPRELLKSLEFEFPLSALVSGSIIAAVITPAFNTIYIPLTAGVFAMGSKHLLRIKAGHIFNPANFGILAVTIFSLLHFVPSSQTWWAASPFWLVIILGLFVVYRINGWLASVPFLVFLSLAGLNSGISLASVLGPFISGSFLFFAGIMLIEPMTSSRSPNAKIAYGVIAAVFSYFLASPFPDLSFVGALALANIAAKPLDKYVH